MRYIWKRSLTTLVLVSVIVVVLPPTASAVPADSERGSQMVVVCQPTKEGGFRTKRIAAPAAERQAEHGWLAPGDAIEDQTGYVVGDDCSPRLADSDLDGVADLVDNCPESANADQADNYGSSAGDACEDTDSDGIADVSEAHFCLNVNGVVLHVRGTSRCEADPSNDRPNVAVSHGDNAVAVAVAGSGNVATASGEGAKALAQLGDDNTATAVGLRSSAVAYLGSSNTAVALGSYAGAVAGQGSDNSARAYNSCSAVATGGDGLISQCGV